MVETLDTKLLLFVENIERENDLFNSFVVIQITGCRLEVMIVSSPLFKQLLVQMSNHEPRYVLSYELFC